MILAGVDAGSRAVKVALLDMASGRVFATGVEDQGLDPGKSAERLFRRLLLEAGMKRSSVAGIVATGYARDRVPFAYRTVTEISCHARGVLHALPGTRTIIEIGGQDSKVIRLGEDGALKDFVMNDRCAAGTGRFLEMVAGRLELSLASFGKAALCSKKPAAISSMCAVFAETEIIGLIASGVRRKDVVAGVEAAVAGRIAAMAGRKPASPVVFTGGVALIKGMERAISAALGVRVRTAPAPRFTGAVGAALLAAEIRG